MTIPLTYFLAILVLSIFLGALISYIFLKKFTLIKRDKILILQEENLWYKRALEFAGIGIYKWESFSNKWDWSSKLYDIRGFDEHDEKAKENFYENVHKDDLAKLKKADLNAKKGIAPLNCDYRFVLKNGDIKWFREIGCIINDGSNNSTFYGVVIDVTEEKIKEEQLEFYARIDKLTQVPNRAGFDRKLSEKIKNLNMNTESILLSFIDLNGFKKINDKYGHESGDMVLKSIAKIFSDNLPDNSFFARLGGDEFVLITTTLNKNIDTTKNNLKIFFNETFEKLIEDVKHLSVGAAIGMSEYPKEAATPKKLLSHADAAMYSAKRTNSWISIFDYQDHKKTIEQEKHILTKEKNNFID